MSIVSGIVLFVLIWWTVIFCILPFGNARGPVVVGHGNSAPQKPRLRAKLIATTLISAILWYPAFWAIGVQQNAMRTAALEMSREDQNPKP